LRRTEKKKKKEIKFQKSMVDNSSDSTSEWEKSDENAEEESTEEKSSEKTEMEKIADKDMSSFDCDDHFKKKKRKKGLNLLLQTIKYLHQSLNTTIRL
jgi:hypothetical protein